MSSAPGATAAPIRPLLDPFRQDLFCGRVGFHFQPIVDLQTPRLVGAEALVRWVGPRGHLVPAEVVVRLAEECSLSAELGERALVGACTLAARLASGSCLPTLSVNVSPDQLRDPRFTARVVAALETAGVPPERLCLEITEGAVLAGDDAACGILRSLRHFGVAVGLDDFGTGFMTHSALRSLQEVDVLKIDRQFVAGLPDGPVENAVVGATVELAHRLGARVVAEGVEHRGQAEHLRDLGCDAAQGFLFSRPIPPDALRDLVAGDEGDLFEESQLSGPTT